MKAWLKGSALDARFLKLWAFVTLPVWLLMALMSFGAMLQLKFLPFLVLQWGAAACLGVPGWVMGIYFARRMNLGPRLSALMAGAASLCLAGSCIGLWTELKYEAFHLHSFRRLVGNILMIYSPFMIIGMSWFYRAETWRGRPLPEREMTT